MLMCVLLGSVKGVQARIRKLYPKAIYTHCASHSLNLALNSASAVMAVSITYEKIREIIAFFVDSPCRQQKLNAMITASADTAVQNRNRLITLCATR